MAGAEISYGRFKLWLKLGKGLMLTEQTRPEHPTDRRPEQPLPDAAAERSMPAGTDPEEGFDYPNRRGLLLRRPIIVNPLRN